MEDATTKGRGGMPDASGSPIAWPELLSIGSSGDLQEHALLPEDTPCGLCVVRDGTLVVLTMFRKRLLAFSDGRLSLYADLSGIAAGTIDDLIIVMG